MPREVIEMLVQGLGRVGANLYGFAAGWTIPVTGEIRSPQLQIGHTASSAV